MSRSRNSLLFALAAVAIYLAAIADFYVRVPIYSAAHARFMVGLLPCFAVLGPRGPRRSSGFGCCGRSFGVVAAGRSPLRRLV